MLTELIISPLIKKRVDSKLSRIVCSVETPLKFSIPHLVVAGPPEVAVTLHIIAVKFSAPSRLAIT
jgi:hypothetical protein